jgi:hypothetical protein
MPEMGIQENPGMGRIDRQSRRAPDEHKKMAALSRDKPPFFIQACVT